MSNLVYVGGTKGGATKTTTAHLLCLGAILHGQPAAYVLTDPEREFKSSGRPYGVIDGRQPDQLAKTIQASHSAANGWLIIDGGGNRPAFDVAIAAEVDLCLLPYRASDEDLETVAKDLTALPNALAWPSAWTTNKHAQISARRFIDSLENKFPGRVIRSPVYAVNSAADLLGAVLDSPSTPVRACARRAFGVMAEAFELWNEASPLDQGRAESAA